MAARSALLLVLLIAAAAALAESPNGVHISLTEIPNTMRAMWSLPATPVASATPGYCLFGFSSGSLNQKSSIGAPYTYNAGGFSGSLYDVVLEPIVPDSEYFYKCGSDQSGFSNTFRFFAPPSSPAAEVKIVVWGDMGIDNDVSSPKEVQAGAAKDINENGYKLIVNVGDTSYADDYKPASNNSWVGDRYWHEVEGAAANAPMMLCPGNHEAQFDFAAHLNRTHMPVVGSGPLKRFYYSFNYGPIHFATISTENPYGNNTEQWLFLQDDLRKAAANRANVPWIVVFTHHPFYCSSAVSATSRCGREMDAYLADYEAMFNEFGVDLFMAGHNHMYERTWPVRGRVPIKTLHRPGAPVYVVEGAAGDVEGIISVVFDVPWRAAHVKGFETGYGRIVANATALTYTHIDARTQNVGDRFTLTK